MPSTTTGDVFIPEVATQVATAQFPSRLALGLPGSPFVQAFPPEESLGQEGDEVKFPRWNPLGEFEDLTEDNAMTPEKLTGAQEKAVVQVGGKAVEITDWSSLAARGDISTEAGRQIAILGGRYVDRKLIDRASQTPLVATAGAVASWNAFVDAIIPKWGDRAYEQIGGIVVHSKVMGDLMKDPDFKRADALGEQGSLIRGFVGRLSLYPVFVSDRITVVSGAPDTYENLILKQGALGLKFQRTLLVESDRDILKKNDVIAADVRIAAHQMWAEPRTIIKWVTQ